VTRDPTHGMTTRMVRIADLSSAEELAWERLSSRACEPSLNEPNFLVPAVRCIASYVDMTLFVVERDGEWVASLPLVIIESRGRRPHRVASSRRYPTVAAGGPPLLDKDCPEQAARMLLRSVRHAARHEGWPGVVIFERINEDGPATVALRSTWSALHMPECLEQSWDRAILRRVDDPEFWSAAISKVHKRDLARRRRRLTEALGGEPTLTDLAGHPGAFDEFLQMEAAGWKGRAGSALASREDTAAFFRAWADRYNAAGRLHMFSLTYGGKPIAMQCAVRLAGSLCIFKIAYDESYAACSPGQLLTIAVAQHFGQQMDLAVLDSLTMPDDQHYKELLPDKRRFLVVAVGVGGARDRALVLSLRATRVVKASLVVGSPFRLGHPRLDAAITRASSIKSKPTA
jgi:CelD/BcsL family acetyltransferase involved in cellulose biosynthesis